MNTPQDSPSADLTDERAFLERVYKTYTVDTSAQTMAMRRLIVRTFEPFLRRGRDSNWAVPTGS